jgi:hypothetical protein
MSNLRYAEYHVHTEVTKLTEAALTIMSIEREEQMTHRERNQIRGVLEMLLNRIKVTVELSPPYDGQITNIPF